MEAVLPLPLKRQYAVPRKKSTPKQSRFRIDRLVILMQDRHYTQGDLAERLGVDSSQVSRWLNGINDPKAETLARMADVFNVTADFLLGRVDDNIAYFKMPELTPEEWDLLLSIRDGSFPDALRKLADEMAKRDRDLPKEGSQEA